MASPRDVIEVPAGLTRSAIAQGLVGGAVPIIDGQAGSL